MSIQNVNVKPSTKESTTLRTDCFVRNIHSRNPFDVIRADVVLARMEKQASRGCGLYYEIYASRLLSMVMIYLEKLPLKDRPVFIGAAAQRGYMLTLAEEERAHDECADLMSELAADY